MKPRGFTLIETVVVVALTALMMGVLSTLLVYFYRTNAYVFQQTSAVMQARRGVTDATKLLRQATYGPDGSAPIQTAATSSVSFYVDPDGDGTLKHVSYTRIGTTLYKAVQTGEGDPATTTLTTFVTNTATSSLFRYYNSAGTELTAPIVKKDIAAVTLSLRIVVDTNRGPAPFTLSGTATLRNHSQL